LLHQSEKEEKRGHFQSPSEEEEKRKIPFLILAKEISLSPVQDLLLVKT
jgi:hypothetical protein